MCSQSTVVMTHWQANFGFRKVGLYLYLFLSNKGLSFAYGIKNNKNHIFLINHKLVMDLQKV